MESNKEISQPCETDKPSTSQRAKEKTKDFATGWHIQTEGNKHKVQAGSSQDHALSDTNPHSERQMSNEGQRDEIAHPESRLQNASRNEMEDKVLWLSQNTREMEKFLQERYESTKQESILYGEQEIPASEVILAEHNKSVGNLENQTGRLDQIIEDLHDKMHNLWIKSIGYGGVYLDLEKECNFIETEISNLNEKWAISNKECGFLKNEINDLNSRIVAKRQKQEKFLFHFNELIKEQNKTQKEYDRLIKETEKQLDSRIKEISISNKMLKNLKKELKTYREDISKKEIEKQTFEKKVEASEQAIQKIRANEREISELQRVIKISGKTISCIKSAKNLFLERKSELENEKANVSSDHKKLKNSFKRLEEHKGTLEIFKRILEMNSEKLAAKESQGDNARLDKQSEAFEHYEGISKENRGDKEILESKKKYYNTLSEYVQCYESEIRHKEDFIDYKIKILEYMATNLSLEIKMEDDRLKLFMNKMEEYEMTLIRKKLNKKYNIKNIVDEYKISDFNSFSEDDLTHLNKQLTIIKEHSDNDIEQLHSRFTNLNDQIVILEDHILTHEEYRLYMEEVMKKLQIGCDLYSEERKTIIQECKSYKEDFQEPQNSRMYEEMNAQNMDLSYDEFKKGYEEQKKIQIECKSLRYKMTKKTQEIEKLDELINNLRKDFEAIFRQESEAQKANHLVEAGTKGPSLPHDQRSQITLLKNIEQKNRLLALAIEKRCKCREELYNLGIELLQNNDEMKKNLSDREKITKKMWNHELEAIENFRSSLELLHKMKSDLQEEINAEFSKIASQFETDLQNLQKSYNEKTLELESAQSELTALTKSVQQEKTKRQELQDKLDKLASQANATHHESETITQELEDYCQKLEKSRMELDAAEQKKLLLGTEIELAKEKLEETEKEMKSIGDKWKEEYYEYKKVESELMHLENICEMTKVILEKAEDYEEAKNEYKEAKNGLLHYKSVCEMTEFILEKAENYKKAKDEYENALLRFENTTPGQNTLPYGEDSSTKGRPLDKWLAQALEKAEKARIGLSNARTELLDARTELLNARTELLDARIDASDAVITMAAPDNEDRTWMTKLKRITTQNLASRMLPAKQYLGILRKMMEDRQLYHLDMDSGQDRLRTNLEE
jgi:hypothetical protein